MLPFGKDAFLGSQGTRVDTLSDMLMALVGSTTALSVLTGIHDRQIRGLVGKNKG